jgi:hypothetical protein
MTANNHSRSLGLPRRSFAKTGSTPNRNPASLGISFPSHNASDLLYGRHAFRRGRQFVDIPLLIRILPIRSRPAMCLESQQISYGIRTKIRTITRTIIIRQKSVELAHPQHDGALYLQARLPKNIEIRTLFRSQRHCLCPTLSRPIPSKIPLLTHRKPSIILSASVDINGLIESGGGTGPLKPRQPAQGAILSDQVPNPARLQTGINEKTRTVSRNLFSASMGRGFFVPRKERSRRFNNWSHG